MNLSAISNIQQCACHSMDCVVKTTSTVFTVAFEAIKFLIATIHENPRIRLKMIRDSIQIWKTTEHTGKMDENECPVRFIHGFLSNGRLWCSAQEQFAQNDFHHLSARTRNTFKCIKAQAEEEWLEIKKIMDKTGKKKVDLIGHSQGGLVALSIAKKHPDEIRSVICLGSPVQGTEHANNSYKLLKCLGFGDSAEQMSSESTFIEELKGWLENEAISNPTKFLFISSLYDQIIKPATNSLPSHLQGTKTFEHTGDLYKFVVNNKRHVELKYDHKIIETAIYWLKHQVSGLSNV